MTQNFPAISKLEYQKSSQNEAFIQTSSEKRLQLIFIVIAESLVVLSWCQVCGVDFRDERLRLVLVRAHIDPAAVAVMVTIWNRNGSTLVSFIKVLGFCKRHNFIRASTCRTKIKAKTFAVSIQSHITQKHLHHHSPEIVLYIVVVVLVRTDVTLSIQAFVGIFATSFSAVNN